MRVLLVTSQFAPEIGGVPRLLAQFCVHRPAQLELRALSVRQQPASFYHGFEAPCAVERVAPSGIAGATSLRFGMHLWRTLRHWRPQVVFCGVAYPTAIIAGWLARLASIPYVVYTHSEDTTIQGRLQRLALGKALRHAEGLIAVSAFTREQLVCLGIDPERVEIIHPGVEMACSAPVKPYLLPDVPADRWLLLSVGRLIRRKGQDTVIRALPRLAERVPNVHYAIVGNGEAEDDLRGLAAELGVADRVTFAGAIANDALPAWYHACDVFVLPTRPSNDGSEVEGFGIVFLEAAAAGKPTVGGRAGGVADAILEDETGLLVDPFDVEALITALERLALEPGLAQRLGCAGQARVQREGSAQVFAERVGEVLVSAVHARQSASEAT